MRQNILIAKNRVGWRNNFIKMFPGKIDKRNKKELYFTRSWRNERRNSKENSNLISMRFRPRICGGAD